MQERVTSKKHLAQVRPHADVGVLLLGINFALHNEELLACGPFIRQRRAAACEPERERQAFRRIVPRLARKSSSKSFTARPGKLRVEQCERLERYRGGRPLPTCGRNCRRIE